MENISYDFIEIEIPDFDPEFFDLWLGKIEKEFNVVIDCLSYIFCSDEYLLKINQDYLSHDDLTDIITFNYNEEGSLSGDIFISYERVEENAKEFSNGVVFDELCRVIAHGLLHLMGFNDKSEAERAEMRLKEDLCLNLR